MNTLWCWYSALELLQHIHHNIFITGNNERLVVGRQANSQASKHGREHVPRIQTLRRRIA
jgi:hypothetical protein